VEGLRDLAHARLRDLAQVVREERGVQALHQAVDRGVGGVIGGVRVYTCSVQLNVSRGGGYLGL